MKPALRSVLLWAAVWVARGGLEALWVFVMGADLGHLLPVFVVLGYLFHGLLGGVIGGLLFAFARARWFQRSFLLLAAGVAAGLIAAALLMGPFGLKTSYGLAVGALAGAIAAGVCLARGGL